MRIVVIIAENLIAAGYVANKKGTIIFKENVKDAVYLMENGNSEIWESIQAAMAAAFRKATESPTTSCRMETVRKILTEQQLFDHIEELKK